MEEHSFSFSCGVDAHACIYTGRDACIWNWRKKNGFVLGTDAGAERFSFRQLIRFEA
jgi:hypothetical protein